MRRVHPGALASLGALGLVAQPCLGGPRAEWGVAVYLAGESDLWQTARYVAQQVVGLADGTVAVAALLDGPLGPSSQTRVTVARDGSVTTRSWGPTDTGDGATLARFARMAREELGARRWLLVLLGHGEPPATSGGVWRSSLLPGGLGSDWGAGGNALSPRELAAALADQRWDVVALVACHSASVEYADALRRSARWMVASPAELTCSGMAVVSLVEALRAGRGLRSAREVAGVAARSLAAELAGGGREELVVSVDLARMGDVSERMSGLVSELSRDPVVGVSALEAVRGRMVRWGPGGEMTDVAALGATLSEALPAGSARSAAEGLAQAARIAVPMREGHAAGWVHEQGAVGMGVFLPAPLAEPWTDYVVEAPFARETGWAGFLEAVRAAAVEGVTAPDAQSE